MIALTIENRGEMIAATNYWDSEMARRGLLYLSWNAGAARLLVPDTMTDQVREMRGGRYVIVSRGRWEGRDDALEILFEDGSDSPYCVHLSAEQTDRRIPEHQQGSGFAVAVWTRAGRQCRLPGRYRVVATLPCLQPWSAH